jgi:hypothetical protein
MGEMINFSKNSAKSAKSMNTLPKSIDKSNIICYDVNSSERGVVF